MFARNSYSDALLSAYGLEPLADNDNDDAQRLKRRILSLHLPVFANTEPACAYSTDLRATIATTTDVTGTVECDFGSLPALIVKAIPCIKLATVGATTLDVNDVDVEMLYDQGKEGTLTGREKTTSSSVPNAVPMGSLSNRLLMLRVEPKQTFSVRFRSRYATTGASNLGAAVTVSLTLLWNYAP